MRPTAWASWQSGQRRGDLAVSASAAGHGRVMAEAWFESTYSLIRGPVSPIRMADQRRARSARSASVSGGSGGSFHLRMSSSHAIDFSRCCATSSASHGSGVPSTRTQRRFMSASGAKASARTTTPWVERFRQEFCLAPPVGFDLAALEALAA